ncbi:MAG: hypothetical protein WBX15_12170 [Thermoanaerobaculia bacterium]
MSREFKQMKLTPQERSVAQSLMRGESPQDTCVRLHIARSRYQTIVHHMLERTHAHSQVELVNRLIELESGPRTTGH